MGRKGGGRKGGRARLGHGRVGHGRIGRGRIGHGRIGIGIGIGRNRLGHQFHFTKRIGHRGRQKLTSNHTMLLNLHGNLTRHLGLIGNDRNYMFPDGRQPPLNGPNYCFIKTSNLVTELGRDNFLLSKKLTLDSSFVGLTQQELDEWFTNPLAAKLEQPECSKDPSKWLLCLPVAGCLAYYTKRAKGESLREAVVDDCLKNLNKKLVDRGLVVEWMCYGDHYGFSVVCFPITIHGTPSEAWTTITPSAPPMPVQTESPPQPYYPPQQQFLLQQQPQIQQQPNFACLQLLQQSQAFQQLYSGQDQELILNQLSGMIASPEVQAMADAAHAALAETLVSLNTVAKHGGSPQPPGETVQQMMPSVVWEMQAEMYHGIGEEAPPYAGPPPPFADAGPMMDCPPPYPGAPCAPGEQNVPHIGQYADYGAPPPPGGTTYSSKGQLHSHAVSGVTLPAEPKIRGKDEVGE